MDTSDGRVLFVSPNLCSRNLGTLDFLEDNFKRPVPITQFNVVFLPGASTSFPYANERPYAKGHWAGIFIVEKVGTTELSMGRMPTHS